MKNHISVRWIFTAALLLFTSCSSNPGSPLSNIKTGATQTANIQVPMPEASTGVELNLEFPAGELKLSPGISGYLASGTATYNVADFEPKIKTAPPTYYLQVGDLKVEGISTCPDNIKNTWDLQLANMPMSLHIKAGGYDGRFELGGLSLEKLAISDGGSDFRGAFSAPNNVEMTSFTYHTGAGTTELKGLANANFSQMTFTSGPGSYVLSFDGDLQRDASITIDSSMSTINLIVPDGINAQVKFDGNLSSANADNGWEQNGSVYTHAGNGPTLTIAVTIKTGTLNLQSG